MSDRIDTKAVLAELKADVEWMRDPIVPKPHWYAETILRLWDALAQEIANREALEKRRVEDFIAGAKWWEYDRENATMWQSDQERAAVAADVHFKAQALREAAAPAAEEKK